MNVSDAFVVDLIYEDIPVRKFKSSQKLIDKCNNYEKLTGFHDPDFLLETRINTYTKSEVEGIFQKYLAQNDEDKRLIDVMFKLCEETYNPGEPKHASYGRYGFYSSPCSLKKHKEQNIRELYHEAKDIAEMISSVLYYANDEYPRELEKHYGYLTKAIKNVVIKYCDLRHNISNETLENLNKITTLVEEYHKKQCLW